MAQGPTVEFGDVSVMRETETALLCQIGEKFRWVAHSRLQPGSTVEHPGDLGVLVLPWDFALEFWDGAMSDKRRRPRCDGVRLNGLPCRVARRPGSRFCFSHDPTTAREREAAQALGPASSIVRDASAESKPSSTAPDGGHSDVANVVAGGLVGALGQPEPALLTYYRLPLPRRRGGDHGPVVGH